MLGSSFNVMLYSDHQALQVKGLVRTCTLGGARAQARVEKRFKTCKPGPFAAAKSHKAFVTICEVRWAHIVAMGGGVGSGGVGSG